MSLILVADLSSEPITTADMKLFLRVDIADDDALIGKLITSARRYVEDHTWRSLGVETWRQELDSFPSCINLYRGKIGSITSLKYIDTDGVLQTLTGFREDLNSEPARLFPAYGNVWPSTRSDPAAVQITYATTGDTDEQLLHAVKLLVAHWYEHREAVTGMKLTEMPIAVNSLLLPRMITG